MKSNVGYRCKRCKTEILHVPSDEPKVGLWLESTAKAAVREHERRCMTGQMERVERT